MGSKSNPPAALPVREQARLIDRSLARRLDSLLPEAMRAGNIDMWIIACQEDNLDPIFETMIPVDCWCPILNILVMFDRGRRRGIERINLSMTGTADLFDRPWRGPMDGDQWKMLARIVSQRNPKRIGINIGSTQWAAGGLTHNLYLQLRKALPVKFRNRLVSAEPAAVVWGGMLTDDELRTYPRAVRIAMALLAECFSRRVITQGKTSADDVEWHWRQRCSELGLGLPFKPYFFVFRPGPDCGKSGVTDRLIRPGDFLRCDVGIRYLRLCTDHQRWAYVPSRQQPTPPAGMKRLMREARRLQDIFMAGLRAGATGNQVLGRVLKQARQAGIPQPKVYSHSVGLFPHEPGPLIGLPWEQDNCPGRGDVRVRAGNCFTMELSVTAAVPEWDGQEVTFPMEEMVSVTRAGCRSIGGRQRAFRIV